MQSIELHSHSILCYEEHMCLLYWMKFIHGISLAFLLHYDHYFHSSCVAKYMCCSDDVLYVASLLDFLPSANGSFCVLLVFVTFECIFFIFENTKHSLLPNILVIILLKCT